MLEFPGVRQGAWGNLLKFEFLGPTQEFIETDSLGMKSDNLPF